MPTYPWDDFYVPNTKKELVEWLHFHYKGSVSKAFFQSKPKEQLYAIYYQVRRKLNAPTIVR